MRKKPSRKRKRRRLFNSRSRRRPRTESSEDKFGFQSGSDFTLEEFQKFDLEFKESYFGLKDQSIDSSVEIGQDKRSLPSVEDIEGEYWRIIEQPTDEVEVTELEISLYGIHTISLIHYVNTFSVYVNLGVLWR